MKSGFESDLAIEDAIGGIVDAVVAAVVVTVDVAVVVDVAVEVGSKDTLYRVGVERISFLNDGILEANIDGGVIVDVIDEGVVKGAKVLTSDADAGGAAVEDGVEEVASLLLVSRSF